MARRRRATLRPGAGDLDDGTASLDLALRVASYFGLSDEEARGIAAEVGHAVSHWRDVASALGLKKGEVDRMASAFEHGDLDAAQQLGTPGSRGD